MKFNELPEVAQHTATLTLKESLGWRDHSLEDAKGVAKIIREAFVELYSEEKDDPLVTVPLSFVQQLIRSTNDPLVSAFAYERLREFALSAEKESSERVNKFNVIRTDG